jgi:hypothetical protein
MYNITYIRLIISSDFESGSQVIFQAASFCACADISARRMLGWARFHFRKVGDTQRFMISSRPEIHWPKKKLRKSRFWIDLCGHYEENHQNPVLTDQIHKIHKETMPSSDEDAYFCDTLCSIHGFPHSVLFALGDNLFQWSTTFFPLLFSRFKLPFGGDILCYSSYMSYIPISGTKIISERPKVCTPWLYCGHLAQVFWSFPVPVRANWEIEIFRQQN